MICPARAYTIATMELTWPKLVALAGSIAGAAFMLATMGISPRALGMVLAWPVFPLALIWFPEYFGCITGYVGGGVPANIDTETPAWLVSAAGWFFLVGLPVVLYLVRGCGSA